MEYLIVGGYCVGMFALAIGTLLFLDRRIK